jgi:hypothetical protein
VLVVAVRGFGRSKPTNCDITTIPNSPACSIRRDRRVRRNQSLGSVPRVQERHARRREIGDVPGHDRHAMRQGSRRDERITLGARVWHMKARAAERYGGIDR